MHYRTLALYTAAASVLAYLGLEDGAVVVVALAALHARVRTIVASRQGSPSPVDDWAL